MRRPRDLLENKYTRGVVAVSAGSDRFPGAAILTVGGARRGNAGYVKFVSGDERLQDLVISRFPDVVPVENLDQERVDAIVIGPGMGSLASVPNRIPLVLDGGSIGMVRERGFIDDHPITVITPHAGELRFCGIEGENPTSRDEREQVALQIAREFGVIVVLKGHKTVIAEPEGETFFDEIGGPELATAGTGDVLAGLIGSMLVALKDGGAAFDYVCRAVTLHSRAGEYARKAFTSVTAVEVMESLAFV